MAHVLDFVDVVVAAAVGAIGQRVDFQVWVNRRALAVAPAMARGAAPADHPADTLALGLARIGSDRDICGVALGRRADDAAALVLGCHVRLRPAGDDTAGRSGIA